LRFYFRFIKPNLEMIELELTDLLWERIGEQTSVSSVEPFRAFVGVTAFEDLCREWTLTQARAGFTDAGRAEAESLEASLVDLDRLDVDLRRLLANKEH